MGTNVSVASKRSPESGAIRRFGFCITSCLPQGRENVWIFYIPFTKQIHFSFRDHSGRPKLPNTASRLPALQCSAERRTSKRLRLPRCALVRTGVTSGAAGALDCEAPPRFGGRESGGRPVRDRVACYAASVLAPTYSCQTKLVPVPLGANEVPARIPWIWRPRAYQLRS